MKLAVFRNPADLLSALLLRRQALPEVVFSLPGGWAVPVQELVPETELLVLAKQLGWSMEVVSLKDLPKSIPIFQMLAGAWNYRDPLRGIPGRRAF